MFKTVIRVDPGKGLEIDRLSFLSDGVFAIVLTLLVLELKIPEGLAPNRILPALVDNAPKFAAFVIAFGAASVGWAYSYLAHSVMRRSNFSHMILTLISLMMVSTIPFVSAVMGNYPDSPWGYVPYCFAIAALCTALTLDMVINGRVLSDPALDRRIITAFAGSTGLVMLIGLVGCGLAFWSPRLVFWVIVVVSALIWVDYFYLSAWIGRELARVERGYEGDAAKSQTADP